MTRHPPKFKRGDVVKILHSWARDHGDQVVINSAWDEAWGCYTYFLGGLIRLEEHMLEATGGTMPVHRLSCAEHGEVLIAYNDEPRGCPKEGCSRILTIELKETRDE